MKIRCNIVREGDTIIHIKGTRYTFCDDGTGNKVCDIHKKDHSDYLLSQGGDFEEYKEEDISEAKPNAETHKDNEGIDGQEKERNSIMEIVREMERKGKTRKEIATKLGMSYQKLNRIISEMEG